MSTGFSTQYFAEAKWLIDHPEFEERPATIAEFLGEGYLNIENKVRPGVREALEEIFGTTTNSYRIALYELAMMTGGIGIGKTTFASIAIPYMAHWVLCLKDPQDFFDLLPGSRIAFMQMSTSEQNAREVVFGDLLARIDHSDWFKKYPRDMKFTKQIRFPGKDIWILPGDSTETAFEGYNILGGILDEMDSHKQTKDKDYADIGFNTIESRISSRFIDEKTKGHRGLLICIGQMKKADGFGKRKHDEFLNNPKAHVTRMTIWESLGWDRFTNQVTGERESFWYDPKRKQIVPAEIAKIMTDTAHLIEVPDAYLGPFTSNPAKALRDLAGIPPEVEDQFIGLADRVEECVERWVEVHGDESPVTHENLRPKFAEWFKSNGDPLKRTVHIDIAYSGDGDALGMAMGHVHHMIEDEDTHERKPHIVIDFLLRLKAPGGSEILLQDVRNIVYHVRDELGFRIRTVTMDGFTSTDTMQQLRKRRFYPEYLSVDKSTLPYEDLRDAIYERRLDFPPYVTYLRNGDLETIQILPRELLQLQDTGKKIDHPPGGSKDLADAVAGVVSRLMGDRTYHKRVWSPGNGASEPKTPDNANSTGLIKPGDPRFNALMMPPTINPLSGANPFEITLPGRLRSR